MGFLLLQVEKDLSGHSPLVDSRYTICMVYSISWGIVQLWANTCHILDELCILHHAWASIDQREGFCNCEETGKFILRKFKQNLSPLIIWGLTGKCENKEQAEQNAVLLFLLNIRSTQKVARRHLAIESGIFEHKSGNQPLLWHRHKLQHQGHLPHQQR